jgi:hypothetical protein
MKTLSCLNDLRPYGVVPLTSEADNLGFRCLCDLTRAGVELFCETYGLTSDRLESFAPNRNPGAAQDPHVAAVMLADWEALAVVALFRTGCHTVVFTTMFVVGFEQDDVYWPAVWQYGQKVKEASFRTDGITQDLPACFGMERRAIQPRVHPHVGTRNVHALSGRSL